MSDVLNNDANRVQSDESWVSIVQQVTQYCPDKRVPWKWLNMYTNISIGECIIEFLEKNSGPC